MAADNDQNNCCKTVYTAAKKVRSRRRPQYCPLQRTQKLVHNHYLDSILTPQASYNAESEVSPIKSTDKGTWFIRRGRCRRFRPTRLDKEMSQVADTLSHAPPAQDGKAVKSFDELIVRMLKKRLPITLQESKQLTQYKKYEKLLLQLPDLKLSEAKEAQRQQRAEYLKHHIKNNSSSYIDRVKQCLQLSTLGSCVKTPASKHTREWINKQQRSSPPGRDKVKIELPSADEESLSSALQSHNVHLEEQERRKMRIVKIRRRLLLTRNKQREMLNVTQPHHQKSAETQNLLHDKCLELTPTQKMTGQHISVVEEGSEDSDPRVKLVQAHDSLYGTHNYHKFRAVISKLDSGLNEASNRLHDFHQKALHVAATHKFNAMSKGKSKGKRKRKLTHPL